MHNIMVSASMRSAITP